MEQGNFQQEISGLKTKEVPDPDMRIYNVNMKGEVFIAFNQKMLVPEIFQDQFILESESNIMPSESGGRRRRLDDTKMEIDLGLIFDTQIVKSPENIIDDEPQNQNYTVSVKKFTSTDMMIKVEMSDPLQVSNGFTRDQL